MGGGKWYEREEIRKINQDYVKTNCKITEREKELLEIIYKRKLVRRDMLEIISPSYRNLGSNRTRLINRSIKKMFQNMCIDKCHEKQDFNSGNSPALLSLDRAGSLILGVKHKNRIKHTKRIINDKEYIFRSLPSNFRHINGVNQLEVETILLMKRINGDILKWHHEKPVTLQYGNEKVVVISDVLVELKFHSEQSKPFYAFIEYDTGAESIRYKEPPIIREKILKYKKYKLSKIWEKHFEYFPTLLLVTEDEKRIGYFNKKCKENNIVGLGVYYENYTKILEKMSSMM